MLYGLSIFLLIYAAVNGYVVLHGAIQVVPIVIAVLSVCAAAGLFARKTWGAWLWFVLAAIVCFRDTVYLSSLIRLVGNVAAEALFLSAYQCLLMVLIFVSGSVVVFAHFYGALTVQSRASGYFLAAIQFAYWTALFAGVVYFVELFSVPLMNASYIAFGIAVAVGSPAVIGYLVARSKVDAEPSLPAYRASTHFGSGKEEGRTGNPGGVRTIRNILPFRFVGGFFLSIPLIFMYLWGFGNLSSESNGVWLILMSVFFVVTLPGSLLLLFIGFVSAFGGPVGEFIAGACIFLSVINAHIMGTFYCRKLWPGRIAPGL